MAHTTGGRAAVLGGGIGGVLAAAALQRVGFEVTILERDHLPARAQPRPGAPHGRQLHNLLGRAQLHIEDLLPGFRDALVAAGGVDAEVSTQTHVYELGIAMPERPLGLRIWSAPQPVIEHVARSLLPGDGIVVRDRTRVTGLRLGAGRRLTGVRVDAGTGAQDIDADLVIDAMGGTSHGASWLAESGCPSPVAQTHPARQWYSGLVVRRPPAWVGKPDYWLVFPTFPHGRGGLISPVGDHEWYVSVSGVAPDAPPRSVQEFITFAATLEIPVIADLLQEARPAGPPRLFGKPMAAWKRYDQLPVPLAGFLPIGDAIASLNPLLGQGISVAAWQSAQLARALTSSRDPAEVTAQYLGGAAMACRWAWTLMTLFNPPPDSDVPRLDQQGWNDIVTAIENDTGAHRRYVRMWHLLEPVTVLDDLLGRPKATT